MTERWHDKDLFAAASRCSILAHEQAQLAAETLRGDVVGGFELLVAIVEMLDRDRDMDLARTAVLAYWHSHREAALVRLEPLAEQSERWYALLGSVAEIWASEEPSVATTMKRLQARWSDPPRPSRDWVVQDVESAGERFERLLGSPNEGERLAAAWCAYEITFWTLDVCDDLDPVKAWEYTCAVAQTDLSDDAVRNLGAGSPETLLEKQGELLIDRIESDARSNPRVRLMLSGAWQTLEMDDALWARVENALGEYREGRRENGGQSPLLQYMRDQRIWRGVAYPGGRERLGALLGEVKRAYTIDEVAKIAGRTSEQVKEEVETGALLLVGPPFARSVPLVSLVACYFPELLEERDAD